MGTGVGEAALLQAMGVGAATGAATSAVMGGDPIKGALLGGLGGAVMPGAGAALQGGTQAATTAGTTAATTAGTQAATQAATQAGTQAATQAAVPSAFQTAVNTGVGAPGAAMTTAAQPTFTQSIGNYLAADPTRAAMIGGAATPMLVPATSSLSPYAYEGPEKEKYDGPLSKFSYDPRRYRPAMMAEGGLADTPVARRLMGGGHLGSYSDGGRLLKGPGDGMSDDIPAKIGRKQPARLADGEFVIPADVVSGIGNGSTDAGARKLYTMMDKVRHARTGNKKQGREINADKYMPS